MATRVHMARVRKGLLIGRLREQASGAALVAVASMGNRTSADKYRIREGLEDLGGTANFTKNTLKAKGLEARGVAVGLTC